MYRNSYKLRWSVSDRARFSDRDILRSNKIPSKKKPPPTKDEWD